VRIGLHIRAEQRLGGKGAPRVADEDGSGSAPGDLGREARGLPQSRPREHLDGPLPLAVPAWDRELGPGRGAICRVHAQVGKAVASQARPPCLSRSPRRRRGDQSRIQAQSREHRGHRTHRVEQFPCGRGTVTDHDELALGRPAVELPNQLTCPGGERLASPALAGGGTLRGGQHREEGQGPDPICPRDGMGTNNRAHIHRRPRPLTKWR
jgi:hypothetical protein